MNKVSYSPVTVRSICKVQSARIECTERDRESTVQSTLQYSTLQYNGYKNETVAVTTPVITPT